MADEKTSGSSIAKVLVWPLVAIVALVLFRTQIAAKIPEVDEFSVGSLSIKKNSKLGQRASPDVLDALKNLPESSIFQLISRSLSVTCFGPPVIPASARADHALLIERGMLKELSAAEIQDECKGRAENPNFGMRLTPLGERARNFQLGVLAELSASSADSDSASASQ